MTCDALQVAIKVVDFTQSFFQLLVIVNTVFSPREGIQQTVTGDRAELEHLALDHYAPLLDYRSRQMAPRIQSILGLDDLLSQVFTQVFKDIGNSQLRDENLLFG